jgi:RNA polymerase-binding protein DksA
MGQFSDLRMRLQERLELLSRRVDKVEKNLQRGRNPDWQERATETENDEVLERLDESALQEISQIRAAIGRIDDGSYGVCDVCGDEVGSKRLAALPYTGVCISCAE